MREGMYFTLRRIVYSCYIATPIYGTRPIAFIIRHSVRYLSYLLKSALYSLILRIQRKKEPAIDKSKSTRTVKFLYCYPGSEYATCKKQFNTEKGWGNIEFTTDRYADYYLIVNYPLESPFSYYNPKRTLLYIGEPSATRWTFIKKWREPNGEFFHVSQTPHKRMFTIWHLSKSYHWLKENSIRKTKVCSTVTSDQSLLPLHKKRLQFVTMLDEQISIDIYGKVNRFRSPLKACSQYQGELPPIGKDKGLFPYKYHFASENNIEDNYITEKLTDAILAECLCFYYGTKTAKDWIDSEAFIHIDIMRPAEAISLIKKAIENKEWEKRIHIIRKEKQKILDEMQLFADIERVISCKDGLMQPKGVAQISGVLVDSEEGG